MKPIDQLRLRTRPVDSAPPAGSADLYLNESGALEIKDADGNKTPVGGGDVSQAELDAVSERVTALESTTVTDATTARVLSLADVGKVIRLTNASPCAITVPPQSSVVWGDGDIVYFVVTSTGIPTITEGSGVTVANKTAVEDMEQGAAFALRRTATSNLWDLI